MGPLFEVAREQAPQGGKKAEKGKKRSQVRKTLASEASRVVAWGGEKVATLFPPQTTSRLGSLLSSMFFFAQANLFSLFPQCEAWCQAKGKVKQILPPNFLSLPCGTFATQARSRPF